MAEPLILTGRGTVLCSFTSDDITDEYIAWLNDPVVVQYSNQRFRLHTRQSSQHYLESFDNSNNLFLLIRIKESGLPIGTITAYRAVFHQTADMGIMIGNRNFWGKGIGLDAWTTLMDYLLGSLRLRKITGGTLRCNIGMVRIMERSGMQQEAIRRFQEIVDGQPEDVLYYARFGNK
ncbi:MAG: GNAT family N-acetyltransferase [Syntrophaceae bacterium]|nr:GNAT family N-acetyltransferase [Syntrophaceae bacterium]